MKLVAENVHFLQIFRQGAKEVEEKCPWERHQNDRALGRNIVPLQIGIGNLFSCWIHSSSYNTLITNMCLPFLYKCIVLLINGFDG